MDFKKKLYITIALAAALYLGWCIWSGWQDILAAFASFRWWVLPICLCLAFSNYLIRFTKWHYYLSILKIPLKPKVSLQVFLAGLVMSATPGKFGEVFKSYLVKQINDTPLSRSAPIILAERLTDFIAFVLMALLGITYLPHGAMVFSVSISSIALVLVIVSWKQAAEALIQFSSKLPVVGAHTEKLHMAYESAYLLISPKPLFLATLISLGSWFLECVAFYLVLWGFNSALPIIPTTFTYAFATIMGALLMTPGGIGPTEGAMGGVLILLFNIPKATATSATLIIRVCTLWFAVLVGLVILSFCSGSFSQVTFKKNEIDTTLKNE